MLNKEILLKKLHICVQNHKKHKYIESQKIEMEKIIALFDNVALISKTDLKGNITFVNEMFCATTGYTKEEVIGKPQNIVRHPDIPKEIFKNMWEQLQKGIAWQGSLKNLAKNNTPYFVKATILPIRNNENEIIEYASIRFLTTHEEQIKREFRLKVIQNIRDFRKKEFQYKKTIKNYESNIDNKYIKSLELRCADLEDKNFRLNNRLEFIENDFRKNKNNESESTNQAISKYRSITKELDVLKNKTKLQESLVTNFKLEVIKKEEVIQNLEKSIIDKNEKIRFLDIKLDDKDREIRKLTVELNQIKKGYRKPR